MVRTAKVSVSQFVFAKGLGSFGLLRFSVFTTDEGLIDFFGEEGMQLP